MSATVALASVVPLMTAVCSAPLTMLSAVTTAITGMAGAVASTLMAAGLLLVTAIYVAFVLSYAERACAMPRAGGAFLYVNRALGPVAGWATG